MAMTRHVDVSDVGSPICSPGRRRDTTSSAASSAAAALITQASAGDAVAFATLYDLTAARVYGLALRIVRNPAQAEEVAQESFVEVWRLSGRFDPARGSAISWILMLTHSTAVNRVRSARASTDRESDYQRGVQRLASGGSDTTFDLANASLEARRVHEALAQLSTVHREALELAYLGGCTHSETARRLGVPLGTAKTRIRGGLIGLRASLVDG